MYVCIRDLCLRVHRLGFILKSQSNTRTCKQKYIWVFENVKIAVLHFDSDYISVEGEVVALRETEPSMALEE